LLGGGQGGAGGAGGKARLGCCAHLEVCFDGIDVCFEGELRAGTRLRRVRACAALAASECECSERDRKNWWYVDQDTNGKFW
jgi:hypothetical protein